VKQHIRFCTAPDGVRIAYATTGTGPALVKAANWLSHLEFDWHSPVWQPWLSELSRDHTLVRYDERGCGLSDWEAENLSLDAWVADLETVVDALGLERFPLFGMSHGGAVAIAYAVRHPERVSHLILYGAYVQGRFKRELTGPQLDEALTLLNLIKLGWGQENSAFRQVYTTLFIPEGSAEQARWFNDLQRVTSSPENAARIIQAYYVVDVRELALQVAALTLVLHAQEDAVVPFDEGRRLAALIPHADFVPLSSKNHVLLESEPAWSHFLEELRDFLGVPGRASSVRPDERTGLTPREREVLALLAEGLANKAIARRLELSPKTVRNYVSTVLGKLGAATRTEAVSIALRAGLTRDNP
jgi:pimeloyl-ACP methyl ester carboxylesterase/DNA-binding CsgD family transcriptional regulator